MIVRTQANTIALQIVFVMVVLVIFLVILEAIQRQITEIIITAFSDMIRSGGAITLDTLHVPETVNRIEARILFAAFLIITTITVVFGYIVSKIILRPTRDALQAQKQFIGNIAHELRTPLSIIKTNTEVALLDARIAEPVKKTLISNVEELDRASQIINNLLTLNTLIRPEGVDFKNVDLGDVIDGAVSKLTHFSHGKKVDITISKSDFRVVWGNKTALEQVALNVVKNAITYTPPNGTVQIRVEPDYRNHIKLIIRDTGIGIDRKDLFRIFEPFFRAERSRHRASGGSGLGLTIVSEIVKLHGGKITIQSIPAKGTTVFILLPCGRTPDEEEPQKIPANEISMNFARRHAKPHV